MIAAGTSCVQPFALGLDAQHQSALVRRIGFRRLHGENTEAKDRKKKRQDKS